jgi:hypothetical protein
MAERLDFKARGGVVKSNMLIRWLLGATIVFVFYAFCGISTAAEFSADMTEQQGDYKKSGKIYVKGSKYCMDIVESGDQVIVVVDLAAKKTIVMLVATKEYNELPIDDMTSIMNDPFQAYKYVVGMGEEKNAGEETIGSHKCDKFILSMQETDVMTQWVAKDLGFPIKIVAHGPPDKVMELTNIIKGSVDDAKFNVPDGFTKWIDPATLPVEPPGWAGGIESAPVMTPPFEHNMSAGEILCIKPEQGKSLKIKGVSKIEGEAVARAIPFKDGRPLKEDTWYNNFAQAGTICARMHETASEVDKFVVYAYEGDVAITAKWQEMKEKTVAAGEEIRLPLQGWDNIKTHLVNMADGESVAIVSYSQEGVPLSDDEQGEVKWRTTTLKELNEVDSKTMSGKGDELVFKVEKGKMLIKLGQFDTFKF